MKMNYLIASVLGLCVLVAGAADAPFQLVDNFTGPLPSSGDVTSSVVTEGAPVGLGMAQLDYVMPADRRRAELWVDRMIPGNGQLRLWVKGDKAAEHDLQLAIRHARIVVDDQGRERQEERRDEWLERVPLDFDGWRELTFTVQKIPANHKVWLRGIVIHARSDKSPMTGTMWLDDLRLMPETGKPQATVQHGLIGPTTRSFDPAIALYCDISNFTATAGRVQVRVSVTDRNENPVVDRDLTLELKGGERREARLDLAPENLQLYLPPFRVRGDILSVDLPATSGRFDHLLVMGNGRSRWEDFSDVYGHWLTSGWEKPEGFTVHQYRQWIEWLMGEGPRVTTVAQTTARISRVTLPVAAAGTVAPPGRYAMQLDYRDNAEVYNGRSRVPRLSGVAETGDRFFPGNAFRAGFWIRGDGSGALLQAVFMDYSDMSDFWSGGWKRTRDGMRDICRLDFTDWRYFEVDLPGDGVGGNERGGSTNGIDFPLELTGFRILSWRDEKEKEAAGDRVFQGTVLFGAIDVLTQQAASDALVLHVAYDDANHQYAPTLGGSYVVQNASLGSERTVGTSWALLDRAGDVVAKGANDLQLPAGEAITTAIDLAPAAAKIAGHLGPYRLQVTAYDKQDAAVSAVREIMLTLPDSDALMADFETARSYYAFAKGATPAAETTEEQAHGGKRSLAIDWHKTDRTNPIVSVDPVLPGVPTAVSMWVYGDESGILLYPIFGDQRGVPNGMGDRQYDLLPGRTEDARNAVTVDWKGWRQVEFRLPLVPPTWDTSAPVEGYLPSYPLSLQIALYAPATANTDGGRVYIDDIRTKTHLPVAERVALTLEHNGVGNVLPLAPEMRLVVDSYDLASKRTVSVRASIRDWRGSEVSAYTESAELAPGARRIFAVQPTLATGAYAVQIELLEGDAVVQTIRTQMTVADLPAVLGSSWREAMRDHWQLRKPLRSLYTLVEEDWDWLEHFPGNLQTQSLRQRAEDVRQQGGEPWMLLGYSAYYAAGPGFDEFSAHSFKRRQRDIGHAVDIFLVPKRLADWDNYAYELMRGSGKSVAGWVLWNNPDAASGSLAVPPERFAEMIGAVDKWRRIYSPQTPLLIGGMTPETAIPYLGELDKLEALDKLSGINIRLDVGVRSPEDADVVPYIRRLQQALKIDAEHPRQILLTDLDWAVERRADGLSEFDQAAYLVRAALLMVPYGIAPEVSINNGDFSRLGLGLTYKDSVEMPPHRVDLPELRVKAGWLGLVRTRNWLERLTFVAEVAVQDVVAGRTQALQFTQADGKPAVFVWRNDDPGVVSFARTGMSVTQAVDMLGSPVAAVDGTYAVGKMPVLFLLEPSAEPAAQALARIWVRGDGEFSWPQQVLAAVVPGTGEGAGYRATQGSVSTLSTHTVAGEATDVSAMVVAAGGRETLTVPIVAGSDLILRKRYVLDEAGQQMEVWLGETKVGDWDLRRSDAQLSSGLRESLFVIGASALGQTSEVTVELRYTTAGNTVAWYVFAGGGREYPLTAVGAVHVDQAVSYPRAARNMAGEPMKIGDQTFVGGYGVFAPSLNEIALNGQFSRFRATVGVDAATEGRGSVAFEIYADGKKIWQTAVMSGLDQARDVDLDVSGVQRLRLVVTDGGDGNRLDAANWANARLER